MKSLFVLGAIVIIGSAAAIYRTLIPKKVSCVDEVIEITNAPNMPASMLLAPQSILNILQSSLLPKTITDKIDNVIVVVGIAHESENTMILMKVLVDEDTSKEDMVLHEIETTLHKQDFQCQLNDKNYNIYAGKTLMSVE